MTPLINTPPTMPRTPPAIDPINAPLRVARPREDCDQFRLAVRVGLTSIGRGKRESDDVVPFLGRISVQDGDPNFRVTLTLVYLCTCVLSLTQCLYPAESSRWFVLPVVACRHA